MFGDNIKRLMKENGYTQKELAIRAGCTESAISRYVRDERTPSIRVLKNLAIALGVTVNDIVEGERSKMELKRDEIIKALECLVDNYSENGSYSTYVTLRDALALIKELTDDNEYLKTALTASEARYESRKESYLEEVLELRLKVDELTEENERLRASSKVVGVLKLIDQIAKEIMNEDII